MDAKYHCKTAGLYIIDIRSISGLGCLIIVMCKSRNPPDIKCLGNDSINFKKAS